MAISKLRLLLMLDGFVVGGVETYIITVAAELIRRGVLVYIAGRDGIMKKQFLELGCKVYSNFDQNWPGFERWVCANGINIVNAHHRQSGIYAAKLSKKFKIPFVYTVHFYDLDTLQKINALGVKPIYISVSIPIQRWLKEQRIPSILVPNGINTKKYRYIKKSGLRKKLGIPDDALVLLYASRLEGRKGKIAKLLVKTMANRLMKDFPRMHLIVAGDGSYFGEIKKSVKKCMLKNIHLIGEYLDMPSLYSISNYVIGTGRVALEAMACSSIVIAIGTQGIFGIVKPKNVQKAWRQYFGDHDGDRVFVQGDLEKKIRKAIASMQKQDDWKHKVRKYITQNFEVSKITKQLIGIYHSCLSKKVH